MYDTLSETEGCDLLARLFTKRGYALKRNVQFREYGVEFHIDGWDPQARVGFEFLTSEDDDHDDLSLEEYKALTAAQRRGELALFIIDEVEPVSAEALASEAHEFLDEVADAAHARLKAAIRRGTAARKKAAAKRAAARPTAKAATRPLKAAAKKKPAAKKKAARAKPAKPAVKKAVAKKAAKKPTRGRR
ncbi:MAG: hypothetical protein ACKO40_13470 [Planctomycetaceae bacterium]